MIVDMWEKSEGAVPVLEQCSCPAPCICAIDDEGKLGCYCDGGKQSYEHVVPLKPPTQEKEASPPYAYV